jgi:hypothetical protein
VLTFRRLVDLRRLAGHGLAISSILRGEVSSSGMKRTKHSIVVPEGKYQARKLGYATYPIGLDSIGRNETEE